MNYIYKIQLPSGVILKVSRIKDGIVYDMQIDDLCLDDQVFLAKCAFDGSLRKYACNEGIIEKI